MAGKTIAVAVRGLQRLLAPPLLALALFSTALPQLLFSTALAEGIPGVAGPYMAAEAAGRRGDIAAAAHFYAEALARDSANVTLMGRTLSYQVAAGMIDQAIPVARRLEAVKPGHHLGVLVLAAEALKRGSPERARSLLAVEDDEAGPFVGQLIDAWAAFVLGEVDTARSLLAAVETGNGSDAGEIMATYHLGLLEAAAGRDAEAMAALDRTIEQAGNSTARLVRIRAGVLARLGRTEEARDAVAEHLAKTLGDRRLELLARDLEAGKIPPPVVTTGLEGAAEALFGVSGFLARGASRQIGLAYSRLAAFLDPDLVEAQLLIAAIMLQDAQYDLAIAAFEAVPGDAPEALDAQIGRAEAMHDAGRADEAIAALHLTVAAHPRSIEAFTSLGDMLRRESRFVEAGEAYDGAIALVESPENRHWPLFYQRGIAFERSQQWDKAEADFFKALELEPDQPLVLNYLGYSWVELRKNLAEAQKMIEKAVEQRPEDGYIVDSLGWVLYRLGDFDGALRHMERAVELRPIDPVINDHLGDVLWMVGRRTEARFQWKRALSFEPEEKDAERIRKKLAVGLDAVLAEEAEAGNPAFIQIDGAADAAKANDGG